MSEKEGLLKKRVLELGLDWGDKVFRDADYEKGEVVSYKQLLTEIFDSAKKEFPCYPKCSYNDLTDTTTQELGKSDFAPCEECYAWRRWFLKYFGDSS